MNILLVDDEEFILDYLEESIHSMSLEMEHIFRASSVEEALEVFNQHNIPIVITDIQMPEKSGLDFLEILSQHHKEVKTILLSGYSEFKYAQTAIQYGAVDYLLKPIMEEELEQVLQKVIHEIDAEKERNYELAMAKGTLRMATSRIKEHLLLDLFYGNSFTEDELVDQMADCQLEIKLNEKCVMATIQLEIDKENNQFQKEEIKRLEYAILNIIEELFFEEISGVPNLWFCKDFNHLIHVVIPYRLVEDDFNMILNKFKQLKNVVKKLFQINIAVLVSKPIEVNQDLHVHYLKVLNHFLQNTDTYNDSVHILTNHVKAHDHKTDTLLNEDPTILHLVENKRWSEVVNKIETVLDEIDNGTGYSQFWLIEVHYYLYSCFSYMSHKYGQENVSLMDSLSLLHNPFNLSSTEPIRKLAKEFIFQCSQLEDKKDTGNAYLISQVNTFIQQNIGKDVSLNKISDHVYLHPVYLSRLYKQETGENISAYILRMRMEKAATLLTTTNKRVADIALEVGYQKPQYFINLFKKAYQLTPQKYRSSFRI